MTDLAAPPRPAATRSPACRARGGTPELLADIAGLLDRDPAGEAARELRHLLARHAANPAAPSPLPACTGPRARPLCVIGSHPAMLAAAEAVTRAAPTRLPVLILGESGTGKGVFAEMVHRKSGRSGPFVKINCTALPETLVESELFGHEKGAFTGATQTRRGRFELADGGTLFLDEIGDTTPAFQARLLRVLQDGEFERVGGSRTIRTDVRIVAATNRDLSAAVADGSFRADLYYRLSAVPLTLPPLRERREDIPELAGRILDAFARETGRSFRLGDDAAAGLAGCAFPGNIRELENCVRRAAIMAGGAAIVAGDLACRRGQCPTMAPTRRDGTRRGSPASRLPVSPAPEAPRAQAAPPAARPAPNLTVERDRLVEALATAGGSQAKAARLLGLSPRQVGYAVRRLGIDVPRW